MNDLKFAIKMELDGEKYYREQAEINKNNSLHAVCLMLADDEKKHAQILTDRLNETASELTDSGILSKAKNVFEGLGNIKVEGKDKASQLDFYRFASQIEQQSIDLYTKYLAEADEAQEKELFQFLIQQEKQHFEILDTWVSLLKNAEDWVENAEFGNREEY